MLEVLLFQSYRARILQHFHGQSTAAAHPACWSECWLGDTSSHVFQAVQPKMMDGRACSGCLREAWLGDFSSFVTEIRVRFLVSGAALQRLNEEILRSFLPGSVPFAAEVLSCVTDTAEVP